MSSAPMWHKCPTTSDTQTTKDQILIIVQSPIDINAQCTWKYVQKHPNRIESKNVTPLTRKVLKKLYLLDTRLHIKRDMKNVVPTYR